MRNISHVCPLDPSHLKSFSDEQLMACLRAGLSDALDVLFARYQRLVMSIALKILRDPEEAEDITQEVFLEIFRSVAQFDSHKGTTKVWIMQYAYHRSLSRRHRLNTRQYYPRVEISEVAEIPEPSQGNRNMPETRRLVKEALRALKPEQKRTIELAYFEGLSMKEIAGKTGESLIRVRHHYYRGLNKMRALLQQQPEVLVRAPREAVDAEA